MKRGSEWNRSQRVAGSSAAGRARHRVLLHLRVWARLPQRPVVADVARGTEQAWEVDVEESIGAGLGGVDRDVHGGADRAGAVADGDSDRADAGSELLVGEGPAAGAHGGELIVER